MSSAGACSQTENEKPRDAGHWRLFSTMTTLTKHSEALYCFSVSLQLSLFSVLISQMSAEQKMLVRSHTLTYTSRALYARDVRALSLWSQYSKHICILKRRFIQEKHSVCLYKTRWLPPVPV